MMPHIMGYLLKVHPNIMHQNSLKDLLTEQLQCIKIIANEAIALDVTASDHYQCTMDSGNDPDTYTPLFEVYYTSRVAA